jgi:GT2 family glycosyltransferase
MGAGPPAVAVSVIVPARNAEATIGATLAALHDQTFTEAFEVIVVDGGSQDATASIARERGVRVLHNPGLEPAGARNLGARAAAGELLAFTDADCEPAPAWLAAGVRALARADLVQGRVLPAHQAGPFDRTVSVGVEHGLYETASLFVRRAWLDRVGGFQRVPGVALDGTEHFGEDAWFGWRCRRAGARTAFESAAAVRHAVFPRAAREWIAEHARRRHFPPLVAAIPELRGTFLHHRMFLSPTSMRFDLALAGALAARVPRRLAPGLPIAWGLSLPYALDLLTKARRQRAGWRYLAAAHAADALSLAALLAGSLRARSLVL